MKNEIKFLGENLYKYRKEKGISQEELANKIGVSRQAVYKWETGERIPDIANLNALCEEFDKCLEDFIEGAEYLVKNDVPEEVFQNENQNNLSGDSNKSQDNEAQSKDNRKKIKKIIKGVLIFIFVIYLVSVIFKAVFFSTMFAKLNKYKGADNYTYQKRIYYSGLISEEEYLIRYKNGVQVVTDFNSNNGKSFKTWYYYKSPEEKATYGIDYNYLDEEKKYTYYYQEGFAYKNSSPYELASEISLNNYSISNILNPLYVLNIDLKNKDLIIEKYDKNPQADNQVYIKKIKYIDLETGLLTREEEYELDKLTSYNVYYNYEFNKIDYEIELSEEDKKKIIDNYILQEEKNTFPNAEYQFQQLTVN